MSGMAVGAADLVDGLSVLGTGAEEYPHRRPAPQFGTLRQEGLEDWANWP